jgi:ATP-dependent Clp protease adaptor protein ClpS
MASLTHTDLQASFETSEKIYKFVGTTHLGQEVKPRHDGLLVLEPRTKVKRPPFYKVVMLNDDYTPMDFVVEILTSVFRHTHEDAINIMLQVHKMGSAVAGIYTRDVAETKVEIVINTAKINEYPLQCVMEKE